MPTPHIDLAAYLRRIGLDGDRQPTRATLDEVVAHHAEAIAFENLDPFLGVAPSLEPARLQAKLVRGGRGGWCFEQNLLLLGALHQLGFAATGLAARVLWGRPEDAITRRSHMLLLVGTPDGDRIVDVGFGGVTLTASLALDPGPAQPTPLEDFRLLAVDGEPPEYILQVLLERDWRSVYRFDLQPQLPIDYEAVNWYLATSPASPFTANLMMARASAERRYALSGTRLTIRSPGGPAERRSLASPSELRRSLEEDFLIDTSGLSGLDEAYKRLV